MQISVGCNLKCSYCIVPSTRGREVSRPFDELVDRGRAPRRRGRPRDHAARPERQLLRARHPARPAVVRRAAARDRRDRHRARPLHVAAPEGHPRGRHRRARRAAQPLRAHPPAAAVGLDADPQGDAPHVHQGALPRPRRAHPRARPRRRADDRHHRRLPGRDRRGLRAHARRGRAGRLRRRVHLHLLAAPRHRGGRAHRPVRPARGRGRADGAPRRGRPAPRPRAGAAVRRADDGGARRGLVAQGSDAAARPHAAQQGRELHRARLGRARPSQVEIEGATSQTLSGSESLLARAAG